LFHPFLAQYISYFADGIGLPIAFSSTLTPRSVQSGTGDIPFFFPGASSASRKSTSLLKSVQENYGLTFCHPKPWQTSVQPLN